MHVLAFETKRAHWRMVGFAARLFGWGFDEEGTAELEYMTAARYDILFAIWQLPPWITRKPEYEYEMSMQKLIARLGLHPSTVSKTVKGLVKRGYVEKTRPFRDKRFVSVRVTEWGLKALMAARDMLYDDGPAFLFATTSFARNDARWPAEPRGRSPFHEVEDANDPTEVACAARLGRDDDMLLAIGEKVRALGEELGSTAWPIYDPDFTEDRYRRVLQAEPRFAPERYALTLC